MLRPCPYRQAQLDGQLTCHKIGGPDREVTPAICGACPAAQIGCANLRFSLTKVAPSSLLIRWGNGKQEMLEADPPHVEMARGACSETVSPIHSPAGCTACPLHQPWDTVVTPTARRKPAATTRAVASRTVSIEEALQPGVRPNPAPLTVNGQLIQPSNILVFRRKTA